MKQRPVLFIESGTFPSKMLLPQHTNIRVLHKVLEPIPVIPKMTSVKRNITFEGITFIPEQIDLIMSVLKNTDGHNTTFVNCMFANLNMTVSSIHTKSALTFSSCDFKDCVGTFSKANYVSCTFTDSIENSRFLYKYFNSATVLNIGNISDNDSIFTSGEIDNVLSRSSVGLSFINLFNKYIKELTAIVNNNTVNTAVQKGAKQIVSRYKNLHKLENIVKEKTKTSAEVDNISVKFLTYCYLTALTKLSDEQSDDSLKILSSESASYGNLDCSVRYMYSLILALFPFAETLRVDIMIASTKKDYIEFYERVKFASDNYNSSASIDSKPHEVVSNE